jgi:hypothetical protein
MKSLEERQAERAERKAEEQKARDASGTGLHDPATSDDSPETEKGQKTKGKGKTETANQGGDNPKGGNGGGSPFPAA